MAPPPHWRDFLKEFRELAAAHTPPRATHAIWTEVKAGGVAAVTGFPDAYGFSLALWCVATVFLRAFGVHPCILVFYPCGCVAWFALCRRENQDHPVPDIFQLLVPA